RERAAPTCPDERIERPLERSLPPTPAEAGTGQPGVRPSGRTEPNTLSDEARSPSPVEHDGGRAGGHLDPVVQRSLLVAALQTRAVRPTRLQRRLIGADLDRWPAQHP